MNTTLMRKTLNTGLCYLNEDGLQDIFLFALDFSSPSSLSVIRIHVLTSTKQYLSSYIILCYFEDSKLLISFALTSLHPHFSL